MFKSASSEDLKALLARREASVRFGRRALHVLTEACQLMAEALGTELAKQCNHKPPWPRSKLVLC